MKFQAEQAYEAAIKSARRAYEAAIESAWEAYQAAVKPALAGLHRRREAQRGEFTKTGGKKNGD